MNAKEIEELDALLLDHHDEGLSDEQHERLQMLLRSSPDARREFARMQVMDAALHLMDIEICEGSGVQQILPEPKSIARIIRISVAACAFFALGILFDSLVEPSAVPEQPVVMVDDTIPEVVEQYDRGVAILSHAIGVEWVDEHVPALGGSVDPGRLRFAKGTIQLEFYRGAQLIVEGPADLELVSANKVICHQGELRAFVPPQARGFTVVSPTTELVDLGTEFAMKVGASGNSEVHVFDGFVELYPPGSGRDQDLRRELLAGSAVAVGGQGQFTEIEPQPDAYPTFSQVQELGTEAARDRLQDWRAWSRIVTQDPRTVVHYDFEGQGRWLRGNRVPDSAFRGAVIGCEQVDGRWPGKGALEFKRAGDRVRIAVPGEFDALTLSAWVRVDAIRKNYQGLLLSDGFDIGRFHWQISNDGDLRFGVRLPLQPDAEMISVADYSAPKVFQPDSMGTWVFVCTVYDRADASVIHYIDGKQVRRHPITVDIPLTIGSAEIGNWGAPLYPDREQHPIRNFNGRIDELTIWNAALPVEDIRKAYHRGRP